MTFCWLRLNFWLRGNVEDVPAAWESLVAALESKQVGETGLAKAIATKYCYKQKESKDDKGQCVVLHLFMECNLIMKINLFISR